MSVVLLPLLLICELIQQAALVNSKLFLNILKILKTSFKKILKENLTCLASWTHVS